MKNCTNKLNEYINQFTRYNKTIKSKLPSQHCNQQSTIVSTPTTQLETQSEIHTTQSVNTSSFKESSPQQQLDSQQQIGYIASINYMDHNEKKNIKYQEMFSNIANRPIVVLENVVLKENGQLWQKIEKQPLLVQNDEVKVKTETSSVDNSQTMIDELDKTIRELEQMASTDEETIDDDLENCDIENQQSINSIQFVGESNEKQDTIDKTEGTSEPEENVHEENTLQTDNELNSEENIPNSVQEESDDVFSNEECTNEKSEKDLSNNYHSRKVFNESDEDGDNDSSSDFVSESGTESFEDCNQKSRIQTRSTKSRKKQKQVYVSTKKSMSDTQQSKGARKRIPSQRKFSKAPNPKKRKSSWFVNIPASNYNVHNGIAVEKSSKYGDSSTQLTERIFGPSQLSRLYGTKQHTRKKHGDCKNLDLVLKNAFG